MESPAFLDVIASISYALAGARAEGLDPIIDESLGAIGRFEGADRVYVTLFHDDATFSNSHEWVAGGVRPHRDSIVAIDSARFPFSVGKSLRGEVWHCPDIIKLPPEAHAERDSFAAFGVKSVLQVPMRNGGRLVGALGVNHVKDRHVWDLVTIDRMRRLSDAIGYAIIRRDADRAIAVARAAADRAARAKDEFLHTVSHELRTPLHAILGFAELLDTPQRDADESVAVQQIIGSGRYLLGLVEEMLAVTERRVQPPIE
jgi:signal transduction histidine kinase